MFVTRMFVAVAAALALLTAVGCQSSGSAASPSAAPHERTILIFGHARTLIIYVPVEDKIHPPVPASSPVHG